MAYYTPEQRKDTLYLEYAKESVRSNLKKVLKETAEKEIDKVVDQAMSDLELGIERYTNHFDMHETVKVILDDRRNK
jgi:hypothetical protein